MSIIDRLYSMLPTLTATDRKIAQVVLTNPGAVVNPPSPPSQKKVTLAKPQFLVFAGQLVLKAFINSRLSLLRLLKTVVRIIRKLTPTIFSKP